MQYGNIGCTIKGNGKEMVAILTLEEIRTRKNALGYSNMQLSKLSGVPIGTLNKILSGETKKPRYEAMHALENVLKEPETRYEIGDTQPNMLNEEISGYGVKKSDKTIDDYYALPEDRRVELMDGVFYDMSAPSVVHQRIVGDLFFQIRTYIE